MKPYLRKLRSLCSLGIVPLFALFLATSQPHRVHHLFENLPAAAGHEDSDDEIHSGQQLPSAHVAGKTFTDERPRPVERQVDTHHEAGHHPHAYHAQATPRGYAHEGPTTTDDRQLASADDSLRSHLPAHEDNPSPLHAQNDPTDAHHDGQQKTDCATQSVVKHSHLSSIPAADITFVFCFLARLSDNGTDTRRFFVYLPFSQRAPPRL
ncbi:MAG TPA: hypothetical protein VK603_27550 [Candidatus Saccharimonadales bacterium]|nr:hypothetical protein [Candidatus Saccharimonadales bacterium]